ncbi:MAG: Mur ligase family protein [Lagierella massiliensis]|nr:Mur ligase family protein [Lagierella massiliensis]
MNYKKALNIIENVKYGHSKDSYNFKRVLDLLELNIDKKKIIQIAGTNGKGSVGTFLSTMLLEQGYNVLHFSSPHLERYEERIKYNLLPISEKMLIGNLESILSKIKLEEFRSLNYFEVSFLLALQTFSMLETDYFIIETGIGGRYDITNVFDDNLLSIITTIHFDHQDILGSTLEEITFHKSGIIKENRKVVSFKHNEAVDKILIEQSKFKNAKLKFLDNNDYNIENMDLKGTKFSYGNFKLKTKVLGSYQVKNISLAILALFNILLDPNLKKIQSAVEKLYFEGRMEVVSEKPLIILDGAHNFEGIKSLEKNIYDLKLDNYNLILGSMKDKNVKDHLNSIIKRAKKIILTKIDYERAMDPRDFLKVIDDFKGEKVIIDSVEETCNFIKNEIDKDEKVIITGSLYLIGEFKNKLKDE